MGTRLARREAVGGAGKGVNTILRNTIFREGAGGHHYEWALEHGLSTEIGMLIHKDIHLFIDILP